MNEDTSKGAKDAVDRALAERGPIPHHRLQPIAHAVRQAVSRQGQASVKKPA